MTSPIFSSVLARKKISENPLSRRSGRIKIRENLNAAWNHLDYRRDGTCDKRSNDVGLRAECYRFVLKRVTVSAKTTR